MSRHPSLRIVGGRYTDAQWVKTVSENFKIVATGRGGGFGRPAGTYDTEKGTVFATISSPWGVSGWIVA